MCTGNECMPFEALKQKNTLVKDPKNKKRTILYLSNVLLVGMGLGTAQVSRLDTTSERGLLGAG